jgi:hypothetical protein
MDNLIYELDINNQKYEIPQIVAASVGKERLIELNSAIDSGEKYYILQRLNMIYSNYIVFATEHLEFQENGYEICNYVSEARRQAIQMNNYDEANRLLYLSIEELIKITQASEKTYANKKVL